MVKDKVLVLLSGGIDSSVLATKLHTEGFEVHALTVSYSQVGETNIEVNFARSLAEKLGIIHKVVDLSEIGYMFDQPHWMCLGGESDEHNHCPHRFYSTLPMSVALMHSVAMSYAAGNGIGRILWALHSDDGITPKTWDYLNAQSLVASKRGHQLAFDLPFEFMSKADIIRLGLYLDVDILSTRSCSNPEGEPCGECRQCKLREESMAQLETA